MWLRSVEQVRDKLEPLYHWRCRRQSLLCDVDEPLLYLKFQLQHRGLLLLALEDLSKLEVKPLLLPLLLLELAAGRQHRQYPVQLVPFWADDLC